ncbi:MAG: putative kinase [Solimicrobium sp.]|nr:putative kinase [Solimicrobium sp.]
MGLTVVADSVNPSIITRNTWRNIAAEARVKVVEIEVVCTDTAKHRRRVESRTADFPDHALPNWRTVIERQYDP